MGANARRRHGTKQKRTVSYSGLGFSDGDSEIQIDTEEELLAAIQRLMDPPDARSARRPAVEDSGRRRSTGSAGFKDA